MITICPKCISENKIPKEGLFYDSISNASCPYHGKISITDLNQQRKLSQDHLTKFPLDVSVSSNEDIA